MGVIGGFGAVVSGSASSRAIPRQSFARFYCVANGGAKARFDAVWVCAIGVGKSGPIDSSVGLRAIGSRLSDSGRSGQFGRNGFDIVGRPELEWFESSTSSTAQATFRNTAPV